MNIEEFTAEAERLARKATVLKFVGSGQPVGYWHGETDDEKPWICVRDDNRWLTVYLEGTSSAYTVRTHEPVMSSRPLYGNEATSLPPLDAIFLLGSTQIESYLHRHGWSREDAFNDNFPDDVPGKYERLYQSNCPIYQRGIVAVCGGWHMPWPEGDFEELIGARLVVWTFEQAEPWVEVFDDDGVFVVKQRIT